MFCCCSPMTLPLCLIRRREVRGLRPSLLCSISRKRLAQVRQFIAQSCQNFANRSGEGCWGYVCAGEIHLLCIMRRAAILPTRPDQNPKPDQYRHSNGNYLCQMPPAEDRQACRSHAPNRARQCASQFLAWQIPFELFTQRDENEGQAAEHNSGESNCERCVHPHLPD